MLKVVSSGSVFENVIPVRLGSRSSKRGEGPCLQPATTSKVDRPAHRKSLLDKTIKITAGNAEERGGKSLSLSATSALQSVCVRSASLGRPNPNRLASSWSQHHVQPR